MPYHYKKFRPGTASYKKAYAEHLIKKLKKKRQMGYSSGDQSSGE